MVTCNTEMTEKEMLADCKVQPHLEFRHDTFKGVLEAAPNTLRSDSRIDAFCFCLYVALLVDALVERELRRAMTKLESASFHSAQKTRSASRPSQRASSAARPALPHSPYLPSSCSR